MLYINITVYFNVDAYTAVYNYVSPEVVFADFESIEFLFKEHSLGIQVS